MTYEEFINKGSEHYIEMVQLIDTKHKYRMEFTEDEKDIQDYILEFQRQVKLDELRNKFEKCFDIEQQ